MRPAKLDHLEVLQEMVAHSCDAGIPYRSLMQEAREWAIDQKRNGGHDPFSVFANPRNQKRSKDGTIECQLR